MPLTAKGAEIKKALVKEYGEKKGEQVLYAGKNKGTFNGIDAVADAVGTLAKRMDSLDGKFQHHKGKDNVRPDADESHLNAIELRLSHERVRLASAKTPAEKKQREVYVAQIEKERESELKFLNKRRMKEKDLTDDELLAELRR